MEDQSVLVPKPRTYARTALVKRVNLVELVLKKSYSIATAARRLDIKLSTAKLIVKKFRQEGCFFEKKEDRIARLNSLRAKEREGERCQEDCQMVAPAASPKPPVNLRTEAASSPATISWPVYYPFCPYYPSENILYFYL